LIIALHEATISSLDLSVNQVTRDQFSAMISSLKINRTVVHVELRTHGNCLDDQQISELIQVLQSHPRLSTLSISSSQFGHLSLTALTAGLVSDQGFRMLEKLDLNLCQVLESGAQVLLQALRERKAASKLIQLRFNNEGVQPTTLQAIEEELRRLRGSSS
jgi:hypothetical protein